MNRIAKRLSHVGSDLHPALKARIRRAVGRNRHPGSALLSVIVPMYNVAPYLDRCLTSLVNQSYENLELVIVDDGSTDEAVAMAGKYARYDSRIRLIKLPHGGNGRARNAGIAAARGKFLAFADADDVVPGDAYAVMMAKLAETGSDFCVGSYGRIRGSKKTPVRLAERLHAQERRRVSVTDIPGIIDDVFLWNKVFRRQFWDRHVGAMPENIRYEDQETTARAYLRAGSFDVLTDVVYWWRIREDGSSITQAKYLLEDLRDRLTVAGDVTALFEAEAPPSVAAHWYRRLLGTDLIPYLEQVPDVDEEFWQLLHAGVGELYAAGQQQVKDIDPQARVLLHLTAEGRREDIRRAVVDRINNGTASPLVFADGRIFAEPPLLQVLQAPVDRGLLEVLPEHLELVAELEPMEPAEDDGVTVRGFAYLRNVDLRSFVVELTAGVSGPEGFQPLEIQHRRNPELDIVSGDRNCSYADAAFSLRLETPLPSELIVRAEVEGHLVERTVPVSVRAPVGSGQQRRPTGPQVTGFAADPAAGILELVLADAPATAAYALVTSRFRIPAEDTAQLPDGRLRLRFPLATTRWGRELQAPPSGSYTLRWNVAGVDTGPLNPAVPVAERTAGHFTSTLLPSVRVRALRTAAGSMAVSIAAPLANTETGTFHQYRLRREVFGTEAARPELTPGILFESFGGKSCTDSPRAISDYLAASGFDEPLYWSVADLSVPVPDYAVPLLQGSEQWYRKLASTRRLVNNNNFPWYFRKTPGQYYLQTWHGTPLKRIGLDVPQRTLSLSYRDLMAREAKWWDLLLAQNDFAAATLPAALGYTGEVLTAGYPRNDSLQVPGTRDRVRRLLGIPSEQNVVLYAPTWRDSIRDEAGRSDWVGFLDVAEASRRLGPGWKFLIRGHHNVAGQRRMEDHPAAIDVTDYPEVNDLYLASDALVTDYSSAMFDFAVLNQPMFFLAPDLAEYRRTRGLYVDLDAVLPAGVRMSTTAELTAVLERGLTAPDSHSVEFAERYASADSGIAAAATAAALLAGTPSTGAADLLKNLTGDHRG